MLDIRFGRKKKLIFEHFCAPIYLFGKQNKKLENDYSLDGPQNTVGVVELYNVEMVNVLFN